MLSVYLAGSCYPPPQQTTSRGSGSFKSVTAELRERYSDSWLFGEDINLVALKHHSRVNVAISFKVTTGVLKKIEHETTAPWQIRGWI